MCSLFYFVCLSPLPALVDMYYVNINNRIEIV